MYGTNSQHVINFTYIIASKGVYTDTSFYNTETNKFNIKVIVADGFNLHSLDNLDFYGKKYITAAINKSRLDIKREQREPQIIPKFHEDFYKYYRENAEDIYYELTTYAKNRDIKKIEEVFYKYPFSIKYRAEFWKCLLELELANK